MLLTIDRISSSIKQENWNEALSEIIQSFLSDKSKNSMDSFDAFEKFLFALYFQFYEIRKEMMDFLYRELMTDHWMRAQSLLDVAAENSDRADHGPYGAFDGWPAGTMDALVQMGFPEKAM